MVGLQSQVRVYRLSGMALERGYTVTLPEVTTREQIRRFGDVQRFNMISYDPQDGTLLVSRQHCPAYYFVRLDSKTVQMLPCGDAVFFQMASAWKTVNPERRAVYQLFGENQQIRVWMTGERDGGLEDYTID